MSAVYGPLQLVNNPGELIALEAERLTPLDGATAAAGAARFQPGDQVLHLPTRALAQIHGLAETGGAMEIWALIVSDAPIPGATPWGPGVQLVRGRASHFSASSEAGGAA